jgi:signal transduction histidine kinase
MTTPIDSSGLLRLLRGLSGKVLGLSIIFVLIGEMLIFLPSIANFRIQWLKSRIAQAEIAALAAEAAPGQIVDEDLRTEILKGAGVTAVSLTRAGSRQLMLRNAENAEISESFDLRSGMYYDTMPRAVATLLASKDRIISVVDFPPNMSGDTIEVALHEAPLSEAMRKYALNILGLSVVLSLIVAGLIFAALYFALVRPMRRLSANMVAFGDRPEDPTRIITPSQRNDEIGMAERELHSMQTLLQSSLNQKAHLAALGLAASKVSHDLRNMLTSAQLISDRMADVKDPTVQRFAPKLITSLDRAINFLNQTIRFGRAQEPPPNRDQLRLHDIVAEVIEQADLQADAQPGPKVKFNVDVASSVIIDADKEQLTRILTNLVRNGVKVLQQNGFDRDPSISLSASRKEQACEILIADNGPGVPQAIRDKLFQPFQSADAQGGTGLGLAISAELVAAHGGEINVVSTGPEGTVFRILIPDRGR